MADREMNSGRSKRKSRGLRPDNRVQVTLTIGRDEYGKPIRKSFYGSSRADAVRQRDEYKLNRRMGLSQDKHKTVSEWVDTCLELYRGNVNDAYINVDSVPYKRLKREIGTMPLSAVRESDLQRLLNRMDGMSYSTVTKYKQAIMLVFSKAFKNKLITDDPSENIQTPRCERGSHRALERWETDCIMQNWHQHRCGLWAMLMLLCGLRRGEMIALRWDNVDLVNRVIHVREVAVIKTNQAKIEERAKTLAGIRDIPICDELFAALSTIPKEMRLGYVCTSAHGELISASAFDRGWNSFNLCMQRICNGEDIVQSGRRKSLESKIVDARAIGKEYVIFKAQAHDLRHTFATALYDAGIDVKTAQYYLGHADIRMTLDLYTHLSHEREKRSRSQLVGFLDGWLQKR